MTLLRRPGDLVLGAGAVLHPLEGSSPVLYAATRTDASSPFGVPRKITSSTGFVEGPTLSPDEKSLCYHKREGDRFVIYRATRP